jgi:hypothetical protein
MKPDWIQRVERDREARRARARAEVAAKSYDVAIKHPWPAEGTMRHRLITHLRDATDGSAQPVVSLAAAVGEEYQRVVAVMLAFPGNFEHGGGGWRLAEGFDPTPPVIRERRKYAPRATSETRRPPRFDPFDAMFGGED